ncbi:MAG TPA: hypothetical protein VJB94_01600 [Candidatus Nanoarchaeia archaeon]|nr:hypothetical protein [Candidatus Nanoarchaeia archaeon]
MKTKTQEVRLKVQEALQEEAYKGIVRIDSQTMREINVKPSDIIEIEGDRITLGIVDRAYPSDIGQEIMRIDGIIRRNAKTGIGDYVRIRKADVKEAKSITIAPAQQGVMIQADPFIFKKSLIGRPLVKGDLIISGGTRKRKKSTTGSPFEEIFNVFEEGFMGNSGFGGLKFIVVDANPANQSLVITENTNLKVIKKAVLIENGIPADEGIELSKIINVKNLPDIKGLIEVKSSQDMQKLAEKGSSFVNRYEGKTEIIYFVGQYFYRIKK